MDPAAVVDVLYSASLLAAPPDLHPPAPPSSSSLAAPLVAVSSSATTAALGVPPLVREVAEASLGVQAPRWPPPDAAEEAAAAAGGGDAAQQRQQQRGGWSAGGEWLGVALPAGWAATLAGALRGRLAELGPQGLAQAAVALARCGETRG